MIINTGRILTDLTFDEETHTYTSNGSVIPSVTQIMRPLTEAAYGAIPKDVLRRAAEFGTAVHACTEYLDSGDLDWDSVDPEWLPYVNAYVKFKEDVNPKIISAEVRIAGERFAGTIDRIAEVRGELWIIDIKTTSAIHPHVGVQLAAYEALFLSGMRGKFDSKIRRFALQLCEDGTYRLKEFKGTADDACFACLLNVYNWMKNNDLADHS